VLDEVPGHVVLPEENVLPAGDLMSAKGELLLLPQFTVSQIVSPAHA
jgi:hypothetical protein